MTPQEVKSKKSKAKKKTKSSQITTSSAKEIEELTNLINSLQDAKPTIVSGFFWDQLLTKLVASLVSIKIWTLAWILVIPYHLTKQGLLSGDHYMQILIVVAPLIIGAREFSKSTISKNSQSSSSLLGLKDRVSQYLRL